MCSRHVHPTQSQSKRLPSCRKLLVKFVGQPTCRARAGFRRLIRLTGWIRCSSTVKIIASCTFTQLHSAGTQYTSSGTAGVQPAARDANSSQAFGPGLQGCVALVDCRIYVQLRDRWGSPVVSFFDPKP